MRALTGAGSEFIIGHNEDMVQASHSRIVTEFMKYLRAYTLHDLKLGREELEKLGCRIWFVLPKVAAPQPEFSVSLGDNTIMEGR